MRTLKNAPNTDIGPIASENFSKNPPLKDSFVPVHCSSLAAVVARSLALTFFVAKYFLN